MPKIENVVNTIETDGPLQINEYMDGTIGIEDMHGNEVKGIDEDFVFLIRELMPLLRNQR